jgi:hypothetical protein
MVILLVTSVLILGLLAIGIYLWQKPTTRNHFSELPPPPTPRGLFSDNQPVAELTPSENNGHSVDWRTRVLSEDLGVLLELKDRKVYSEALDELVSNASSNGQLCKLASYVATNNLPVNRSLAEAMRRAWETSPNRQSTAKMLHFAALSDDAVLYNNAIELSLKCWREGKIKDTSASELLALFNGEFWLLSLPVRSSGNGFVLKRTLSSARRELEGTTNN